MTLRIATFNVENLDEESDAAFLDRRVAILRTQLERLRADVLCLQEVHGQEMEGEPRRLLVLERLLEGTPYADFDIVHTMTSEDQAYDKRNLVVVSRFPVAEVQQHRNDLVSAPIYQLVTAIPADEEPNPIRWERPILYVTIPLPDGRTLHLINLHLKSRIPTNVAGQKVDSFTFRTNAGWAEGFFLSSMKRVGQALETRVLVDGIFDQDPDAAILVCGDFNAEPGEVPVEAIAGRIENTNNPELVGRVLTSCGLNIAETARYTHLHHGQGNLLDHMLISRSLLGAFRHAEIHNETLHDESLPFAFDRKFPESDHAPFVVDFGL